MTSAIINICGNSPIMLTDSLCSLLLCRLFLIINVPLLTSENTSTNASTGTRHEHEHEYVVIESRASAESLPALNEDVLLT